MTTPQRVLDIAASRIGYYAPNDPEPGSEAGRYVADLWARYSSLAEARADGCYNWESGAGWLRGASTEIWWCCLFVSMCYHMAGGRNMPGIPNYNCDNLKSKAREYILPDKHDAAPGDFVLFDWGGEGSCDHIGIIERNCGSYVQTIEGNTSGSNGGSQSSGNGVWRRTRNWGVINCIIRPIYTGEEEIDMPLNSDDLNNIWNYDGNNNKLNETLSQVNNIANKISELSDTIDKKTRTYAPIANIGQGMVRLYNNQLDAHRYSTSDAEIAMLTEQGWQNEGSAFFGPSGIGVYGLVNPWTNDTILTINPDEAASLANDGWESRGVIMLASSKDDEGAKPLHRLYNAYTNRHIFTVDEEEKDSLSSDGWNYEGIAFYVI